MYWWDDIINVATRCITLVYTEDDNRDHKRKNIQDITGTRHFTGIFWQNGWSFQQYNK